MNCPQCHAPMTPLKKPGFGSQIVAAVLVGAQGESPSFRCPKCQTEVASPSGDNFVLYIENLDDFRKSCLGQLSYQRVMKPILGGFHTGNFQNQLDKIERFLRILDAMTLEERLQPDLIDAAGRQRITTESGTTADDLDQLFQEFTEVRTFYQEYRSKTFWQQLPPWRFVLGSTAPLLIGVSAGVLAQFSEVVATVLSCLGYYLISAVVLFLVLTRFKHASALVSSSWQRVCLFVLVIPAAMALGLFLLVHDWVLQEGLAQFPVCLGCFVVAVLAMVVGGIGSVWVTVRRARREHRSAKPDALAHSESPVSP